MQAGAQGLEVASSQALITKLQPLMKPFEANDLNWQLQSLDPLLDSANMQMEHWSQLCKLVLDAEGHDCTLIIHGTDSMAYSAAALTFLLHQRYDKTVVLTGSQYPLGFADSDAESNFSEAVQHCLDAPQGVHLSFAGALLHGARAVKADANGLQAFAAPKATTMQTQPSSIGFDFELRKRPFANLNIVVLTVTPALTLIQLQAVLASRPDALILRVYGVGTLPDQNPAILMALSEAHKAGTVLLGVTQCAAGQMDFSQYQAGHTLLEAGVINGRDLTLEAALAKLAVLLHLGYPHEMIRTLVARNLCGEMNNV